MTKLAMIVLFLLGLSGCGGGGVFVKQVKDAKDKSLIIAKEVICEHASIGSIRRVFGRTDQSLAAWRNFCQNPEGIK